MYWKEDLRRVLVILRLCTCMCSIHILSSRNSKATAGKAQTQFIMIFMHKEMFVCWVAAGEILSGAEGLSAFAGVAGGDTHCLGEIPLINADP